MKGENDMENTEQPTGAPEKEQTPAATESSPGVLAAYSCLAVAYAAALLENTALKIRIATLTDQLKTAEFERDQWRKETMQ
jgi:hypothetical protein